MHIFPIWNRGGNLKEQDINEKGKKLLNNIRLIFQKMNIWMVKNKTFRESNILSNW